MTMKGLGPARSRVHEHCSLEGTFRPNGTGAVDNTLNTGGGFTVTRTGVGTFDIAIDKETGWGQFLVGHRASIRLNAAADVVPQFGAWDAATGIIVLRLMTAGVAADVADNANNVVSFELSFNNGSFDR